MILERMSHDMDNRKWESINLGYTKIVVLLKRGGLGETHNFKKMLITHAALLYAFIGGISPMDE